MAINKEHTNDPNQQSKQADAITVNDEKNPTQQQRDEAIGQEPDTKRLRSERESVEESRGNSSQQQ